MVTFLCPRCGGVLDALDSYTGLESTCPFCRQAVIVPTPPVVPLPRPHTGPPWTRPTGEPFDLTLVEKICLSPPIIITVLLVGGFLLGVINAVLSGEGIR